MTVVRISRFGLVNGYLVREDDGLTLVDALLPGSHRAVLAAARRLVAPIVRIALTHAHGDHIGALDALVAELPGVEVLISSRDARLMANDLSVDPDEPQDKLKRSRPGTTTSPTRTFEAGGRVGSLQVQASPGHSPGHVAFLDPRDGTLYCGDAYSTLGGVATSAKTNPRFPLVGMSTWNRPLALQSARALRALDADRLAPGHGKVLERPGAAMDRALARGL